MFYRMSISDRCETEKITSLVKHHVAKAKLTQQHEAELTFTLPFESMDTFPGRNQTVLRREREREEQPHGFLLSVTNFLIYSLFLMETDDCPGAN